MTPFNLIGSRKGSRRYEWREPRRGALSKRLTETETLEAGGVTTASTTAGHAAAAFARGAAVFNTARIPREVEGLLRDVTTALDTPRGVTATPSATREAATVATRV